MPRLPPLKLKLEGRILSPDLLGGLVPTAPRDGLPDLLPADREAPVKLRLVHLKLVRHKMKDPAMGNSHDQPAYAANGAYFGPGPPLYHAETADGRVRLFRRAGDRDAVKALIRTELPNANFYR